MARIITINANSPKRDRRIEVYNGENLTLDITGLQDGQTTAFRASTTKGGAPLIDVAGSNLILTVDDATITDALGEEVTHFYNLWKAQGADETVIESGMISVLPSIRGGVTPPVIPASGFSAGFSAGFA